MATDAKHPSVGGVSSAKTTTPSAEGASEVTTTPLAQGAGAATMIVDIQKPKRKRKYTRGLKDAQRLERGVAKASRRVGRAIATGLDTYLKRRDRSSYKRRDGAIRDALKNWSKAANKAMRKASGAPYDITRAFDTRPMRRTVRFAARSLARPFPFLR